MNLFASFIAAPGRSMHQMWYVCGSEEEYNQTTKLEGIAIVQ